MANVLGKFYSGVKLRKGATPESPTELIGVQPYPLNPPGSGNFVTIDTNQTITGEKNFDAKTILGDSSTDYVLWDKISKVFSIFTQAQFTHKYRGGAAGALNIGQYDVDGNSSINNTSNGLLALGTNNTTRVEIEAGGDVLLKKVDSGTGETLMIEPSGRVVKGSGVSGGEPIESASLTVKFDNYNGYIHGNSGALSGNILFDFTNEILGSTAFMLHNSATSPTFPAETKIISGTYTANIDNYIWFCITKKTTGRVVQVTIGKL